MDRRAGCSCLLALAVLAGGTSGCTCSLEAGRDAGDADSSAGGSDAIAATDAGCMGLVAPATPRPRSPQNGAYAGAVTVPGSLRPTFTWDATTAACGGSIEYELYYGFDPLLSDPTVVATAATSHRPDGALPVSTVPPVGARVYWRVRACVADLCSAYSHTWWVDLGRSDRDLDGDGYADVIVTATNVDSSVIDAGRVYVYRGGPGVALDDTPDVVIDGSGSPQNFGDAVVTADVNGDGFGDLMVAQGGTNYELEQVNVFLGGTPFDGVVDAVVTGGSSPIPFYSEALAAGDLNCDGYADLAVSERNPDTAAGVVYVYLGGPGPTLAGGADAVLVFDAKPAALDLGGDFDGDGFRDLAVGTWNSTNYDGAVHIFRGGPAGLEPTPSSIVSSPEVIAGASAEHLGEAVAGCDLDGDGFSELVAGAPVNADSAWTYGRVYIWRGGPSPTLDPIADATLDGDGFGSGFFGTSAACAADIDGDGLRDLAVGTQDGGEVYVYRGMVMGPVDAAYALLADAGTFFGNRDSLAGAGDVNGDGFSDLVVGANQGAGPANEGRAYVYFGGSGFLDPTADGVLTGEGPEDFFGGVVY